MSFQYFTAAYIQAPSSSKQEVCNKHIVSRKWHHDCQKFGIWGLRKPEKYTLHDLLLSQIISRKVNVALCSPEVP